MNTPRNTRRNPAMIVLLGLLCSLFAAFASSGTAFAASATEKVQVNCHLVSNQNNNPNISCGSVSFSPIPAGATVNIKVFTSDQGSPGQIGEVARISGNGVGFLTNDVNSDGSTTVSASGPIVINNELSSLRIDHAYPDAFPQAPGARSFMVDRLELSWETPPPPPVYPTYECAISVTSISDLSVVAQMTISGDETTADEYEIDMGDGSEPLVREDATSTVEVHYTYEQAGSYQISASARFGQLSAHCSTSVEVEEPAMVTVCVDGELVEVTEDVAKDYPSECPLPPTTTQPPSTTTPPPAPTTPPVATVPPTPTTPVVEEVPVVAEPVITPNVDLTAEGELPHTGGGMTTMMLAAGFLLLGGVSLKGQRMLEAR